MIERHPGVAAPNSPTGLVCGKDIGLGAAFAALAALVWLTPRSFRPAYARTIARAARHIAPAKARAEQHNFAASFGLLDPISFYHEVRTATSLEMLDLLALNRPAAPAPEIELVGRGYLDRAVAAGQGAVLWVAPSSYGPMMTKMALHRAGLRVWHLGRPNHGFSNTVLGRALLNPLRIRTEDRFLAGRIMIRDGDVRTALAELAQRLGDNQVISITMGTEAKSVAVLPFLTGTLTISDGPVRLASTQGAALLPVVTLRRPDGSFVTEIGGSITAADDVSGDAALLALAAFLEPHVRTHPEQFARSSLFWPRKAGV